MKKFAVNSRDLTTLVSIVSAVMFGFTAWEQFYEAPGGARIVFALAFALVGGGTIWIVYLILRLLKRLYNRFKQN